MATLYNVATVEPNLPYKTFPKSLSPHHSPVLVSANFFHNASKDLMLSTSKRRNWSVESVTKGKEIAPVKTRSSNGPDQPKDFMSPEGKRGEHDDKRLISRTINATIVLGFGTLAVTKLLTIDHDYWHVLRCFIGLLWAGMLNFVYFIALKPVVWSLPLGFQMRWEAIYGVPYGFAFFFQGWTLFEILRYAPEHNWTAYEEALKSNPVLAKMAISGIVYSIGDWIAQCYEGKPLLEFDMKRMFRSGLVGFTLHGSLSHYYYQFCELLFPFQDWWVVPAKVAFDQTVWAAFWNSIYYIVLGFLRFESPENIFRELKATFWPMLTAGWKLWPFAHLITYGVIPVEQRLLWVDCVELIWVTILSTYSNEKSKTQLSNAAVEADTKSSSNSSKK